MGYGYSEGKINFAPTFKIEKGTDIYSKKRSSAWTDRVIYRSNQRILKQFNYDSNNLVKLSDHRPVFAQFMLKFNEYDSRNHEIGQQKR